MLSLNYENINHVMTQILKLSCVSFSYVSISYVLAKKMASAWRNFKNVFSRPLFKTIFRTNIVILVTDSILRVKKDVIV